MRAILSFVAGNYESLELAEAHYYFVQAPSTVVSALSSASHAPVALFCLTVNGWTTIIFYGRDRLRVESQERPSISQNLLK